MENHFNDRGYSLKNSNLKSIVFLIAIMVTCNVSAFTDMINKSWTGVALKGYDVVEYFKDHKPIKGSSDFMIEYNHAKWYFATAEDRDAFSKAPQNYAPQYGGFCAFAVSQNHTADIDPNAWTIVNNKLYLNYNSSIQARWNQDRDQLIAQANQHWPNLNK